MGGPQAARDDRKRIRVPSKTGVRHSKIVRGSACKSSQIINHSSTQAGLYQMFGCIVDSFNAVVGWQQSGRVRFLQVVGA